MDIDDLSNSQLLLLTILVNFVMAIATGIVTVSLLDKAPPTVLQSVNRIVEHTVETVVPAAVNIPTPTQTASQPTEEDQLVAAISGAQARTVAIYDSDNKNKLAIGTYLPKSRALVTAAVSDLPDQALAVFPDGSTAPISLSKHDASLVIYGFADDATLPNATIAPLIASASLKQGQAVIALTADGSAVTGIVSKVSADGIVTTLPEVPAGSAALSLSGALIGVRSTTAGSFVTGDAIGALLSATSTVSGS